jgi:hypothetical protein
VITLTNGAVIQTVILSGANYLVTNQTYQYSSVTGTWVGLTVSSLYIDPPRVGYPTYRTRSTEAWGTVAGIYESVDLITWTGVSGGGSLPAPTGVVVPRYISLTANTSTWTLGTDGNITFPDGTNQTTAYQVTKSITHTANLLAAGSSFGQGSSIAITDNYQTERVSITNSLGSIARATLANITSIGKIVILTSTSPHETFVDRYGFSGAVQSYVEVSNGGNGVVILMSLGSNGWKLMSTNE